MLIMQALSRHAIFFGNPRQRLSQSPFLAASRNFVARVVRVDLWQGYPGQKFLSFARTFPWAQKYHMKCNVDRRTFGTKIGFMERWSASYCDWIRHFNQKLWRKTVNNEQSRGTIAGRERACMIIMMLASCGCRRLWVCHAFFPHEERVTSPKTVVTRMDTPK